tara:strand:+ start:956 stop:2689 length:1734 start_codon:yes stop_codon:yes gene_type:complete
MPAINGLLPVVAASNSQQQSSQSRADEARVAAVKNAASATDKGLAQDAAAEKRLQQKRFINAYEEGIQEQGRDQERRSQRVAMNEREQQDNAAALAASGNALPREGEALPTVGVPKPSEPSATVDSEQNSNPPIQAQGPSAPSGEIAQGSDSTATPTPNSTETLSFEQQQQAAAEAFHALVSANNGKAEGKQQAALSAEKQGIALAASAQVQKADTAIAGDQALSELAGQTSTKLIEGARQDLAAAANEADKSSQLDVSIASLQTQQAGADQNVEDKTTENQSTEKLVQASLTQTQQSAANLASAVAAGEAQADRDEPAQAQLVRAWRGIDAQEQRSAMTASTQAARQDPIAVSVPISHSGQIQQFAQSLRQASGQPELALNASTGERSAANASQSGAEISPLRAETASANAASTSGRALPTNNSFAQIMQASNFGQALGAAVGQNAWGESIAQRVSLMAGLKVSSAQIQLDPPELGAMTVKVSVNGDQASVSFHSPHAVVRDALELSFPRLQEMMGQQGMQLVDAQVSDNSSAGQGTGERASGRSGQPQGETLDEASGSASSQIVQVATGLIDFYA